MKKITILMNSMFQLLPQSINHYDTTYYLFKHAKAFFIVALIVSVFLLLGYPLSLAADEVGQEKSQDSVEVSESPLSNPLNDASEPIESSQTIEDTLPGSDRKVFEKAVDAYLNKEYSNAIEGFNQLIDKGIHHPHIWHNLGLAYHQTHQKGYAIHAFKMALVLAPNQSETLANLEQLRETLPLAYQTREVPLSLKILFFFYYLFPFPVLLLLIVVFIGVGSAALVLYFLRMRTQPRFLWISLVLYFLGLFTMGVIIAKYVSYQHEASLEHGVAIQSAPLRMLTTENPNETVPVGTEVAYAECDDPAFVYVTLPDSRTGYVFREHVLGIQKDFKEALK